VPQHPLHLRPHLAAGDQLRQHEAGQSQPLGEGVEPGYPQRMLPLQEVAIVPPDLAHQIAGRVLEGRCFIPGVALASLTLSLL
jgi:hypothetical protein